MEAVRSRSCPAESPGREPSREDAAVVPERFRDPGPGVPAPAGDGESAGPLPVSAVRPGPRSAVSGPPAPAPRVPSAPRSPPCGFPALSVRPAPLRPPAPPGAPSARMPSSLTAPSPLPGSSARALVSLLVPPTGSGGALLGSRPPGFPGPSAGSGLFGATPSFGCCGCGSSLMSCTDSCFASYVPVRLVRFCAPPV